MARGNRFAAEVARVRGLFGVDPAELEQGSRKREDIVTRAELLIIRRNCLTGNERMREIWFEPQFPSSFGPERPDPPHVSEDRRFEARMSRRVIARHLALKSWRGEDGYSRYVSVGRATGE